MATTSVEEEIVKALSQDTPAVLATVVSRAGSAPRAVGAKMLIMADGSFFGTIGGGSVEAKVLQEAARIRDSAETQTLHFALTNKNVAQEGSVCGGTVTIFLEHLPAGLPHLVEIYKAIAGIKKRGGRSLLATIVAADGSRARGSRSKALIYPDGETIGSLLDDQNLLERVQGEADRVLGENQTEVLTIPGRDGQVQVLLEPVISDPAVFIFGGGHISACLAPLVKSLGFRLVIIDDRPEFANRERFPEADEVIVDGFEDLLDKLPIDEQSYLILVTRGHLHDRTVLEQALRTKAKYIGMIGSRRKVRMIYQNLMEKGISEDRLRQVHAPIGLKIGAETPEEIAISILAELIQVRAGRA